MGLQKEIDAKRAEIRTDDYSMSIGEWISLYKDDELDIHPEFQRFFRWSELQKTKLDEEFLHYSRGGMNASFRIPKLIPLGRKYFDKEL